MHRSLLIVTDAWHPQVNGVVRVLSEVKARLELQGFTVSVIHPEQYRTVPLPFYPNIRIALFPRRRIQNSFREADPEYIYIATEGPLGIAARNYCIRRNLKFVTQFHTRFDVYADMRIPGLRHVVLRFLRWFHKPAFLTLVSSENFKQELAASGFKNLVVWPFGVDTRLFVRNPNPPLPPLPKPVFLFFGRLAHEKNPEDFFKLELPGTKLVVGDGPLRSALEKKYKNSARFVGYRRGQELVDWMSLADVLVFPSRSETFGLSILEALACGIPVAAYNVIGPRDIITSGKDGVLSNDLRAAALQCLSLSRDVCRRSALRYSWDVSVEIFIKLLVPK